MKAMRRFSRAGLTIAEVLIVVAIIAMAYFLVTPAILSAVNDSLGRACSTNLNMIESAKDQFRRDNPGVALTSEQQLAQYLPNGIPTCPAHGVYSNITNLNAPVTCSLDQGKPGFHNLQPPQ
jgi:Tfp pilus assembly protein PilE